MADEVIQEIYSQIQSKKKILATPPQEDAPSVDITNIRMPTPPSYKVGDKVQSWASLSWSDLGGVAMVLGLPEAGAKMYLCRVGRGRKGISSGVRRSLEVLLLPFPSWGQPAPELFTCRGSERTRDFPTVTQQAIGSTVVKAHGS